MLKIGNVHKSKIMHDGRGRGGGGGGGGGGHYCDPAISHSH